MAKVTPSSSSARSPAVDAYLARCAPFAQTILAYLREVIHETVPGLTEEIKWSHPFFLYHGVILGNMAGFKQHCSLGLWGAEVTGALREEGVVSGGAMGSFGRITSLKDLPSRPKLAAYIRSAAQLIAEGRRTKAWSRPRVAKPEPAVPAALAAALQRHPAAARAFAAMAPGCRREYCTWIAEAKRDATRDARIATALEWIAQGKARNWKYETPRPAAAAKTAATRPAATRPARPKPAISRPAASKLPAAVRAKPARAQAAAR